MSMLWIAIVTAALGFAAGMFVQGRLLESARPGARRQRPTPIPGLLHAHFGELAIDRLSVRERVFPYRMRADLQRCLEAVLAAAGQVRRFTGVHVDYSHEGITFPMVSGSTQRECVAVAPQTEDVDIGDDEPVRCFKNGLWLMARGELPFAVLLSAAVRYGETTGWKLELATPPGDEGDAIVEPFFEELERAVARSACYRGKILSLEQAPENYSGRTVGIRVHKLRQVARDQVILPGSTLELLERNVIQFVKQRVALARLGQATKKGVLFYGPPGTGKTHTVQYLARALEGHTTLLITAEQLGLLGEYMVLARLLAPSIVVMEDVDLIARERTSMGSPCEEALLNKLLNEMDGLRPEADILFILTTNRPEDLEAALASRPGRVDQAIEFPLPDDEGRRKLIRLYAGAAEVGPATVEEVMRRTERVSAAFIKELMRRSAQFQLARQGGGAIEIDDVTRALDELLFSGGSLNLKLLGAEPRVVQGAGA